VEALPELLGPSREEPGCLSFHLFRSMRDRRLFYIHSRGRGRSGVSERGVGPYQTVPRASGYDVGTPARGGEDGTDRVKGRADNVRN
jgi:hypothetical protein